MSAIQNIKVAVDAVVFGYSSQNYLSVLLIKRGVAPFKNTWALPGGLVLDNEFLDSGTPNLSSESIPVGRELPE